jgi:hypothetical protein
MLESIEEVGYERGYERGFEEGKRAARIRVWEKITINLLRSGLLTKEQIAQVIDLDIVRINELEETLKSDG